MERPLRLGRHQRGGAPAVPSYEHRRTSRLRAGRVVRTAAGLLAVFSAIIIMQASVGGSIKATTDRLIGTIGGAVAGVAVAYLLPHASVLSLGVALVIALVPLTLLAALWPNYRIAPLTAVIVLLTPGAATRAPELGVLSHCRNYAW